MFKERKSFHLFQMTTSWTLYILDTSLVIGQFPYEIHSWRANCFLSFDGVKERQQGTFMGLCNVLSHVSPLKLKPLWIWGAPMGHCNIPKFQWNFSGIMNTNNTYAWQHVWLTHLSLAEKQDSVKHVEYFQSRLVDCQHDHSPTHCYVS